MGYMRHHAIVVTGFDSRIMDAHAKALELFARPADTGMLTHDPIASISDVTPEAVNGYRSFFVAPDGSKEWWSHSDAGNAARDELIEWISKDYSLSWAEIQYGDDDGVNKMLRHDSYEEED